MTDDSKFDMTVAPPAAFEEWMSTQYGHMADAGYDLRQLREAFLAGWEAAVMEHC